MSIFLPILWTVLIVVAIALPICLGWRLWKQFRAIFKTLQLRMESLQKAGELVELSPTATTWGAGATGDEQTLAAAHQAREEVRQLRWYRRQERLDHARERWEKLGLVK